METIHNLKELIEEDYKNCPIYIYNSEIIKTLFNFYYFLYYVYSTVPQRLLSNII